MLHKDVDRLDMASEVLRIRASPVATDTKSHNSTFCEHRAAEARAHEAKILSKWKRDTGRPRTITNNDG